MFFLSSTLRLISAQTCNYMRFLVSDRKVWYTVLLQLPPKFAPKIGPFDTRLDANYRALAVGAVRGFHNWMPSTSAIAPQPMRRIGPCHLPEGWRHPARVRLVPGTDSRYLIEFRNTSFHCFDIERDEVTVEYELDCNELLGYGLELQTHYRGSIRMRVALTVLYPEM